MAKSAEDEMTPVGELFPRTLSGAAIPVAGPTQSGWAPRRDEAGADESEVPTRHMESGVAAYVSRIDEIRRLYAEGSTDDALLLASTVSPPPQLGWSLASVPVLARTYDEIMKLPLDHRAGFFLGHVDGESSLETILDLVPLPEAEVLAIFESLVALDVIRLEAPVRS